MPKQEEVDAVIEEMICVLGLTERNILQSLTEQQCRVWVKWAILGRNEAEIAQEVYAHCKRPSAANVRSVIRAAQVKIISELLSDIGNIKEFFDARPELVGRLKELIGQSDE